MLPHPIPSPSIYVAVLFSCKCIEVPYPHTAPGSPVRFSASLTPSRSQCDSIIEVSGRALWNERSYVVILCGLRCPTPIHTYIYGSTQATLPHVVARPVLHYNMNARWHMFYPLHTLCRELFGKWADAEIRKGWDDCGTVTPFERGLFEGEQYLRSDKISIRRRSALWNYKTLLRKRNRRLRRPIKYTPSSCR